MICSYCKSDIVYLKESEGKTGVYCQNCDRWLKWVDGEEKTKILNEINKRKREIRIDGADYDIVREKLRTYKKKYEALSEELRFFKQRSAKQNTSDLEASAMYEKALKLKELTAKIAAYDEVLLTLRLK
ncbi:hypothetical protein CCDG5_1125 [[Clostridium] cellulosi]|jgi:hypothetical protein|uniref:Uncharacterized protein n=1 Tax=[Clostridium] cellulosi TaxID=29343 RepID=A0A078KNX8_9FIRM|nr:MAG: hypothetical protein DIU81_07810 [[Clostridium] cellulosi]CDZ24242.1 hypothetical protein CCDG5_1125 [[Clostridium] cellulosi]